VKETITDDELAELEQHLEKLRKYTGLTLPPQPIFAISMRVARLMWPDMTDDAIEQMLRASGYIRSDEDE